MVIKSRSAEAAKVEFMEVGQTGVFMAQISANRADSMSVLKQNGFRPLSLREALTKMDQNPELRDQLKGKDFYLEGGLVLSGWYTFNEKGLSRRPGNAEKNIHCTNDSPVVYPSAGYDAVPPPCYLLYVNEDAGTSALDSRFYLNSTANPGIIALVVIGVKNAPEDPPLKIRFGEN